jgi:Tfp pilus assembly protein PilF
MFHLNQYTPEGVQRGLAYLHEAVEKDPADPLAYAGLALGYTLIGHSPNPPPGVWAIAREAAAKALELDPLFPEAHGAMAEIQLYYDWDWDGAEQSFKRALQLNPNLDFAHAHYSWYFELIGNSEKSIEQMKRARQIGPLTPIYSSWLAWLYRTGAGVEFPVWAVRAWSRLRSERHVRGIDRDAQTLAGYRSEFGSLGSW